MLWQGDEMKTYSYFRFILAIFGIAIIGILAAWLVYGLTLAKIPAIVLLVFFAIQVIGLFWLVPRYLCPKCGTDLFPNWLIQRQLPGPKACRNCGHFPWKL